MNSTTRLTKRSLTQLQKEHGSDSKIGEALGVSGRTVFNWRKQLGVPSRHIKNERRNVEVLKLRKKKSAKEISEKTGLSISHVYRILKHGG